MCITKVLTQTQSTTISYCPDCGMLNVWHHSLLLCFTAVQFEAFYRFTQELDYTERLFAFPDGTQRLILCTPNRDINFVFTRNEWEDFNEAMTEALYLQEVYQLIR